MADLRIHTKEVIGNYARTTGVANNSQQAGLQERFTSRLRVIPSTSAIIRFKSCPMNNRIEIISRTRREE